MKLSSIFLINLIFVTMLVTGQFVFDQNTKAKQRELLLQEQDNQQFIHYSDALLYQLVTRESAQRGFLLTGDESFLGPYKMTGPQLAFLQKKISPNFSSNEYLQLTTLIKDRAQYFEQSFDLANQGNSQAIKDFISQRQGVAFMSELRRIILEKKQQHDQLSSLYQEQLIDAQNNADRFEIFFLLSMLSINVLFYVFSLFKVSFPLQKLANNLTVFSHNTAHDFNMKPSRIHEIQLLSSNANSMIETIKKTSNDLLASNQKLTMESQSKSDFFANMSHELRTPLNGIYGVLQLLNERPLTGQDKKLVGIAHDSAIILKELVNNVLDLEKLAEHKVILKPVWYSPSQLFERLVELHRPNALAKHLNIFLKAYDLPQQLLFDKLRVEQITNNIVGNAIKFTEKGLIEIQVSYSSSHLYIKVVDTGIGISPENQSKLFERFSQIDDESLLHLKGSGLGLVIIKELVELMNGSLHFSSRSGVGTTVEVTIPCDYRNNAPEPKKTAKQLPKLTEHRVLIVEDNSTNMLIATSILKDYFGVIEQAQNGQEALFIIAAQDFDLVITDIEMPKLDGIGLNSMIKKMNATLPVIALTGNAMPEQIETYYKEGFVAIVNKPFSRDELVSAIESIFSDDFNEQHNYNLITS